MAAYANEPDSFVVGRAVEHAMLTHPSVTVTAVLSVLVPLLLKLYRGSDLRTALDDAMAKMRPPKIQGPAMARSLVGPGYVTAHQRWKYHMECDETETTKEMVHRLLKEDDTKVIGFLNTPSRLSSTCDCEHMFPAVLYLAYKYADDPKQALLQNIRVGGHSTARGSVLGAIFGAAHGKVPFVDELCAKEQIDKEVAELVATL